MSVTKESIWLQEQSILLKIIALPERLQEEYLSNLHRENPTLYTSVNELVQAWKNSSQFLEDSPIQILNPTLPLSSGQQLGAYEILELLGQGGMGRVYKAKRIDGAFEREVAIKVMHPGLADGEFHRRLCAEGQILAGFDHPYIGRLLDVGYTPSKEPYLIMEYIDGVPIDTYISQNQLSIKQKIRLMIRVCEAVEVAHQNLIVHRDLKPSNILVTKDGTPKLLDFGIAKWLDTPQREDQTQTGLLPMTPRYASPEQREGRSITTVSDVYSLGMLLFQVLTGKLPDHESIKPPSDSWRVSTKSIRGQAGGSNNRAMVRAIQGDLDNIVMMALRQEPERRYQSAHAMAEDLQRFLNAFPVHARPETAAYLALKFVKRKPISVSVAMGILLMILGFMATVSIQNRKIRAERDKATMTAQFLTNLFEQSDPDQPAPSEITLRSVLDKGADQLQTDLNGNIETQAALQHTIGKVYFQLGEYQQSIHLLQLAQQSRRKLGGPAKKDLANSLELLAAAHQFNANFPAAEQAYLECLAIRKKELAPNDPDLISVTMNLGTLYHFQGRFSDAQPFLESALAQAEKYFASDDQNLAACMDALGANLRMQGKNSDALSYYKKGLTIRENEFGILHSSVAYSLNNIALITVEQDPEQAIALYEDALGIYAETIGLEHPFASYTLFNLADLHLKLGHLTQATETFQQCYSIRKRIFGPDHLYTAEVLYGWGKCERRLGHQPFAEELLTQALRIRKAQKSPEMVPTLLALASTQLDRDQVSAAEQTLCKVFEAIQGLKPGSAWLQMKLEYARLALVQKRWTEAEQHLNETKTLLEKFNEPSWLLFAMRYHLLSGLKAQAISQMQLAGREWTSLLKLAEQTKPKLWDIETKILAAQAFNLLGQKEKANVLMEDLEKGSVVDLASEGVFSSLVPAR
ncbi:MAG: serine/threonine protein kinase [Acidobacteria bacterium]|nr:serine/threonine protein kinase [Acidobacteriota bacterium]